MVKIDEEAMVRPELLLVLVNDLWGPVGNAMDVGGLALIKRRRRG